MNHRMTLALAAALLAAPAVAQTAPPSDTLQARYMVELGRSLGVRTPAAAGERIPDQQYRVVQDFITTDNAGIVPDAVVIPPGGTRGEALQQAGQIGTAVALDAQTVEFRLPRFTP